MGTAWKGRMCWAVIVVARRVGGKGFSVSWLALYLGGCGGGGGGDVVVSVPPHARAVRRRDCLVSLAGMSVIVQ